MQVVGTVLVVVGLSLLILIVSLIAILCRMSRIVKANLVCRAVLLFDAHHN